MSKHKPARTIPRMAGSQVYGQESLKARPGNSVYKHRQQYHVFVGMKEVLVTLDRDVALAEAAREKPLST